MRRSKREQKFTSKCVDLKEKNRKQMCDQIKKDSIQSSEKIKMQEYTEYRKKESKILSNFKLMAQKKARSFKNSSYL